MSSNNHTGLDAQGVCFLTRLWIFDYELFIILEDNLVNSQDASTSKRIQSMDTGMRFSFGQAVLNDLHKFNWYSP